MVLPLLLAASLLHYVFGIALFLVALFLILLILVQRGRGGGLTGALGGMGGQSAFGTKAGDTFTRVTMAAATVWILLSMGAILTLNSQNPWGSSSGSAPRGSVDTPVRPDAAPSGGGEGATPSSDSGTAAGSAAGGSSGGSEAQPPEGGAPPASAND